MGTVNLKMLEFTICFTNFKSPAARSPDNEFKKNWSLHAIRKEQLRGVAISQSSRLRPIIYYWIDNYHL